jgi:hypothetical protein
MKLKVSTTLECSTTAKIDLPINSWNDIKNWYIKWDYLHYTLHGEKYEVQLNSTIGEVIDWKHPTSSIIHDAKTKEYLDEE